MLTKTYQMPQKSVGNSYKSTPNKAGIKSFFFGASQPKAGLPEYETAKGTLYGMGNLAGADLVGTGEHGVPLFDYSKSFQPVSKQDIAKRYDFAPINQAISGYRKPSLFSEKYNPYQFSFESLPDKYFDTQYELRAKGIRRESDAARQKMMESLGPRNAGLLFKAGRSYDRDYGEQSADLNAKLRQTALEQKAQLGKEQQISQAGEDYKGYESRAGLEKTRADEAYRYLQGLESAGKGKLAGQMDATKAERDNLFNLLQLMNQQWTSQYGSRRGAPQGGGFLNSLAGSAGGIASAFSKQKGKYYVIILKKNHATKTIWDHGEQASS